MIDKAPQEQTGLLWALSCVAQQKDTQAWSVLVADVGLDVLRLAMRMTADPALAEDIVQETFILVRDHADRFQVRTGGNDDDARRWILAVATNASLNVARRHRRQINRDVRAGHAAIMTATPISDPSQQTEDVDEGRLLRRELAELPLAYGQVLSLHYFANQDYSQLASDLRVSVSTIRSRVQQGLKLLRERLERCGVTLSIAALTGLLSNLGAAPVAAVALPASTMGIISSSAVSTTTIASASTIASGGLILATVLSTVLAATITLMGWANGWFSSPTNPPVPANVPAAPIFSAVEPPAPLPVVPPGPGVGEPGKPFIMVVKTDQVQEKVRSNSMSHRRRNIGSPSKPNQFMIPLSIDYAYDFTVDWGDGSSDVIQSPLSAALVKVLNQAVTVKKGNLTLEEMVSYLREVGQAPIVIDPQFANRLRQKETSENSEKFNFFEDKYREYKNKKTITLRDTLNVMKESGFSVAFNKQNESIIISDGTGELGDLLITRTYEKAGTYTVQISENVPGGFPAIYFDSEGDCAKLLQISQWGDGIWSSMESAFFGCMYLSITATDTATARTETVSNFSGAWCGCIGLTSFPLLNTAAGTDFSFAWSNCRGLTSFPLLNTASGTDFTGAWSNCRGLKSFPLLNTASGTYFLGTWWECGRLRNFPQLNTASGTNFQGAWGNCMRLLSFPLLDTAAGTNFSGAWGWCENLKSFPLLNTAAGTDFNGAWAGCHRLKSFPLLNTAAGTNFSDAWSGCEGLTNFPLLDTSAGKKFTGAWTRCSGLTSFPLLNTVSGTHFSYAWSGCSGLTSFPLLNTAGGMYFSLAWQGCSGLTSFPLLNTAAGTYFAQAWEGCSGLTSFPLLNTVSGLDFSKAWSGCSGLTSFPLLNTAAADNFQSAWSECTRLRTFPLLNFGKMTNGDDIFSAVTLDSASYDNLLSHIAASNTIPNVKFDGGLSKVSGFIGIQARKNLKSLGWTIYDGENPKPKPRRIINEPKPDDGTVF